MDLAEVDSVVDVEADLEHDRAADEHVVSDNVASNDPQELAAQSYKYYTREKYGLVDRKPTIEGWTCPVCSWATNPKLKTKITHQKYNHIRIHHPGHVQALNLKAVEVKCEKLKRSDPAKWRCSFCNFGIRVAAA